MRRPLLPVLCLIPAFSACVGPAELDKGPAPAWQSPPLEHSVSVRDGRTGERIGFDAMLDRLAKADAVFLGETHNDETTHRVEIATYAGLRERRDERVVLALEMFDRDVQPALDAYLRGEIDEPAFLAQARPWSNYRTAYRPMIEIAKSSGAPVVASNFPSPLRRKVATDGLAALTAEERALAPAELLANTPAYWRRVDNAVRGHAAMMGPPPAADDPRLTSVQSLWDNSMGEACALALRRHPGFSVLHVNGGFHSEYWDGTARQLRLRAPDARIATVAIVPVANPEVAEIVGAPVADFVVFTEERAHDVDDGTYAVFVPRQVEYRLHVPKYAESSRRVPLLIWLADEGETADDAFALWKARVGDESAIVVIEAPYRELQDDLVAGGRWYWPDSFAEDVFALREGIERAAAFVLRHQPVDPARVCLAGEGTGATVVSAVSLLSELEARALAFEPRTFAHIADFPLPLPESRGDEAAPQKSLRVDARAADADWWSGELAQYRGVGFDAEIAPSSGDAWSAAIERENAVRSALGLAPRAVAPGAPRAHVVVDGPRARSWARRLADERSRRDGSRIALIDDAQADTSGSTAIDLAVRAADFAAGARLPQCPGAFGGTTVIVMPADVSADERAAWLALQASDPIATASRFHRMVIAETEGERALPVVLGELVANKRTNVLIVPATWCADGATMRALQRSTRAFEDRMTLNWRPGLGGL